MKIVLFTTKLNFETAGGSVMDLHLKAKGLCDLGHEVTVVTAFSNWNKINIALPYKVFEENINSPRFFNIQYGIFHLLKKYEMMADVFYVDGHVFVYGAGFYRLLGGKKPVIGFFNIRLNCWGDSHGNDNRSKFKVLKKRVRALIEKIIGVPIANHVDAFVFNTVQVEKMYLDWGFRKDKSTVIEDFVDTGKILSNKKQFSTNQNQVTIFATGRIMPEKGFDLLVKAINLLTVKDGIKVVICGSGLDEERIKNMVKEFHLENIFIFPGWVEKTKLDEYFRKSDIFVFPSWWLEYGSALLTEALAYGLPCVIPGGGGLEWLVKGAAKTFKFGDVQSLSESIDFFIKNSEFRLEYATKALQRAEELCYENLTKNLEAVCKKVYSN